MAKRARDVAEGAPKEEPGEPPAGTAARARGRGTGGRNKRVPQAFAEERPQVSKADMSNMITTLKHRMSEKSLASDDEKCWRPMPCSSTRL